MISRRNIRVKVMQTLYTIETLEHEIKPGDDVKMLQKHYDLTRQLFVYLVHFLTEVCRYAETDSRNRASKHLPTKEDLNVNIKLAGNEVMWKILENPSWIKALNTDKPNLQIHTELVRKIYLELVETPEYKQYISVDSRDKESDRQILEFILNNLLLPNEIFTSHVEELYTNWDDDCEMVVMLVQQYLQKSGSFNIQELLTTEKWQYAKSLLLTVQDKNDVTLDLIKPKLKNWDSDRIAALDMILMKMGVCEFLYFETIPPKVTINEYIDLAKDYSTPQSGQFVNGILDNIHKDLVRENKMHKVNFKKG